MSAVIDFGFGWRLPRPGARDRLLSWWADCGAVVLDGPDGLELLGFIEDEEEVRRRLAGWEGVRTEPGALDWVRARVAGRVAEPLGGVHHTRPAAINAAISRLFGRAGI